MRVRPYSPDEFEAVLSLWRAVTSATYWFLEPKTEAEDRAYLRDVIVKESALWVAEDEAEIAGYMAICGDLVDRLYVRVERQGQGVGTALLEHAMRRATAGLRLFTHQKNTAACRFYESRGFVAFRFGVSPAPESEPDVEYRWCPS